MSDRVTIRVTAHWDDSDTVTLYTLHAPDQAAYVALLKRLEFLSDLLPYVTQADERADLDWELAIDNMKAALALTAPRHGQGNPVSSGAGD